MWIILREFKTYKCTGDTYQTQRVSECLPRQAFDTRQKLDRVLPLRGLLSKISEKFLPFHKDVLHDFSPISVMNVVLHNYMSLLSCSVCLCLCSSRHLSDAPTVTLSFLPFFLLHPSLPSPLFHSVDSSTTIVRQGTIYCVEIITHE